MKLISGPLLFSRAVLNNEKEEDIINELLPFIEEVKKDAHFLKILNYFVQKKD